MKLSRLLAVQVLALLGVIAIGAAVATSAAPGPQLGALTLKGEEVGTYRAWRVIEPVLLAEIPIIIEHNLPDACLDLWAVVPRTAGPAGLNQDPPTDYAIIAREIPDCEIGS